MCYPSSDFDNQKCFIIELENYIWVVTYIENENDVFLNKGDRIKIHSVYTFNFSIEVVYAILFVQ